jgi:hypothetical protein
MPSVDRIVFFESTAVSDLSGISAVLKGAWLWNVLPTPLVTIATFVGFQGGFVDGGLGNALAGAVMITLSFHASSSLLPVIACWRN